MVQKETFGRKVTPMMGLVPLNSPVTAHTGALAEADPMCASGIGQASPAIYMRERERERQRDRETERTPLQGEWGDSGRLGFEAVPFIHRH
jgi:hypothetical protein